MAIMARHIDESKPLSAKDRAWLLERNDLATIRRVDEQHGIEHTTPAPVEPHEAAANPVVIAGGPAAGDIALHGLVAWLDEHPEIEGDEPVSDDAGQRVLEALVLLHTIAFSEDEEGEFTDDDDADESEPDDGNVFAAGTPYEGWTQAALQEEAGRRELSKSGNKAELLARLLDNDD